MTYTFQPYLESIQKNWYADDQPLHKLLARYTDLDQETENDLAQWGASVAGPLRALAEQSADPENQPRLVQFDAHNQRIDRIVLPESTHQALAEVQGRHRLGARHGDPFVFYSKGYLWTQNGEAGVGCSMACTDGLVRALEALGDRQEHQEAVDRIRSSTAERVYHGAQFVTEIQGGSDVPANAVVAKPDGDAFSLHGQKWFCSNINADYFLVTARPEGAPTDGSGIALFLVPAYLDEDHWQRNGYTVDRLKDKLGTRELATAEVTFDGARAYPVGALDRGIANVLSHVLVTSRVACISVAASSLRQAERISAAYVEFRSAFGRKLLDFPLVHQSTMDIRSAHLRTLASFFELLRMRDRSRSNEQTAIDFRIMLSLCKPTLTRQSTEKVHDAMMLLAGNGIEERFSPLPRIYRDAVIMETWEGPHFLLFTQAQSDIARFELDADGFIERMTGQKNPELVAALDKVLKMGRDPKGSVLLANLAPRLVQAFGEQAAANAGLTV